MEVFEDDRLFSQPVEVRCLYPLAAISCQIVRAKGIGDNQDDVQIVPLLLGRPLPARAAGLGRAGSGAGAWSRLADQALWAPLNFACGARSTRRWEIEGVARHIDSSAAERHAFRFEAGALFEPCVSREAYVPARPHYTVPGDTIFGIVEGPCDLSGCARKACRARDIAVSRDLALGDSSYCLAEPLQHTLLMLPSNDVRIDVSGERLRAFRTLCVAVLPQHDAQIKV